MSEKKFLCGGDTYTYNKRYIELQLDDIHLPDSVHINGEDMTGKSEFHISLLSVRNMLKNLSGAEDQILSAFCFFLLKSIR